MTPTGLPLAYEVMDGNTSDKSTLRSFLDKIESLYGKARRIWLMDRGIPTEAILAEMRTSRQETFYLVGPSRAKLKQYEKKWLELPWQKVRESVEVKLFAQDGELYVLAKSEGRRAKEMAIRRKKLARLLRKLRAMRRSCPKRDQLLMRVGAVKTDVGRAFGFVKIHLPEAARYSAWASRFARTRGPSAGSSTPLSDRRWFTITVTGSVPADPASATVARNTSGGRSLRIADALATGSRYVVSFPNCVTLTTVTSES
jgi:hypothetical protein